MRGPDTLIRPFLRENVQKARADRNDARHHNRGGQNKISHDNSSSGVVAMGQKLMPEILPLHGQSVVPLRQHGRGMGDFPG